MNDALGGIWQKERPVETEYNNSQKNRNNNFVDWFNGSHSSADGESSGQDGDSMT